MITAKGTSWRAVALPAVVGLAAGLVILSL
jgi:hypothetical protein